MSDVRELIAFVFANLVDHPTDVTVRCAENHGIEIFQVQVHPDDLGKVIGKGGQTARAVRMLLAAVSARENRRLSLEIVE